MPSTLPHLPIHHASQPYTNPPSRLRTLDLWLPRPLKESDPKKHVWIVYIHGGAWRDPAQTSHTLLPTLKHLPAATISSIAGIAAVNYRLSPYPNHPSDPSNSDDEERNVQHPAHIKDIATALEYLGSDYKLGKSREDEEGFQWIAAGHSCGATLLCQYISRLALSNEDVLITAPIGVILLEGIYDIPAFVANHTPPKCSQEIAKIYEDIVVGAFTDREEAWRAASPVNGEFTRENWGKGRVVYVCYSEGDELVEEEQSVGMKKKFEDDGWSEDEGRVVEWKALEGGHDWIWEDGRQMVKCFQEMLEGIAKYL